MHRAFDPAVELQPGQTIELSAEESRHIAKTLRMRPGQSILLFNGRGTEATATLQQVTPRCCTVEVIEARSESPAATEITLAQVLPRTARFEWVLQKATELGVHAIEPVIGRHSVVRPGEGARKMQRWRQIIISAGKQSGNLFLPDLREVQPLASFLRGTLSADILLIASLQEDAAPLWECFERYRMETTQKVPRTALLLVGPEGDFSGEELLQARAAGFRPLRLSEHVLRAETAAIQAVCLLQYELARRRVVPRTGEEGSP